MSGCCGPEQDGRYSEIFDERFASSIARRYLRRGLTAPERRIVDALSGLGLAGRSVLEVGGGVGELQLELLSRGAAETVNLELSDAYEEQADELMRASGVDGHVTRIEHRKCQMSQPLFRADQRQDEQVDFKFGSVHVRICWFAFFPPKLRQWK